MVTASTGTAGGFLTLTLSAPMTLYGIPQITVTPSEDARSSARQAYAPAKKKIVRPVRPAEPLNRYAFDPFSRQSGTIQ